MEQKQLQTKQEDQESSKINKRGLALGGIYHVFNRGTRKEKVFLDKADYIRFTTLMFTCNHKKTNRIRFQRIKSSEIFSMERSHEDMYCEIICYCLMSNHFHFVLREKEEGGIAKFIMRLCNGYTKYFNQKNENSGAVFQGVYKSVSVGGNDRYYRYLLTYVHLNPILKNEYIKMLDSESHYDELLSKATSFEYSSLHDLVYGTRFQKSILYTDNAPYLNNSKLLKDDLINWITLRTEFSLRDIEEKKESPFKLVQ